MQVGVKQSYDDQVIIKKKRTAPGSGHLLTLIVNISNLDQHLSAVAPSANSFVNQPYLSPSASPALAVNEITSLEGAKPSLRLHTLVAY